MTDITPQAAIDKARAMFGQREEHALPHETDARLDVAAYLNHHGVRFKVKNNGKGTIYVLEDGCLFDSGHGRNEASIIQDASGKLIYQCFHNSCTGHTWEEARAIISGDEKLAAFMVGGNRNSTARTISTEPKKPLAILTGEQVLEHKSEDKPIISGLLDRKESLVIVARSGIGKSLLTNNIALVGGTFPLNGLFNHFHIPKPFRTLFVQSENALNPFSKRLKKMISGNPQLRAGLKNLFFAGENGILLGHLTNSDFQKTLLDAIKQTEADVLDLDPLISYHGEDENDNASMRRSLDCLTKIINETNTSCIVVHHMGKSNSDNGVFSGRGASAIGDWACNILSLTEEVFGAEKVIKVTHEKSRNFEQAPPFYLQRTADLLFERIEKPGTKRDKYIDAVVKCLTDLGGCVDAQKNLKQAVMTKMNCSEATARRAIEAALEFKAVLIVPGNKSPGYKLPD